MKTHRPKKTYQEPTSGQIINALENQLALAIARGDEEAAARFTAALEKAMQPAAAFLA